MLLVFAAMKKKFLFAIIVPVAMIAISLLGTGAAKLVQTIIVEPNELNKESK